MNNSYTLKARSAIRSLAFGIALVTGLLTASQSHAITLSGWTGTGSFGTSGANGVVGLSPWGDPAYGWISTVGGPSNTGMGFGSETNGAEILSPFFSASSGDLLKFYFNFVTSDGAGYADYAWARLVDTSMTTVALLFTARTTPGGDTVPGFGMPTPGATLTPPSTPIIPGGPAWSPLGGSSGACYSTGCGYTGWIEATYAIAGSGTYALEFGVVNWADTAYDTGMAFDGATIAGTVIVAPEPTSLILLGVGLLGMGLIRRRLS